MRLEAREDVPFDPTRAGRGEDEGCVASRTPVKCFAQGE